MWLVRWILSSLLLYKCTMGALINTRLNSCKYHTTAYFQRIFSGFAPKFISPFSELFQQPRLRDFMIFIFCCTACERAVALIGTFLPSLAVVGCLWKESAAHTFSMLIRSDKLVTLLVTIRRKFKLQNHK